MRAELRPQKLTYRDYLLFPEDGRRHEIIEGEHCVSAAPTSKHQIVLGRLHRALGVFTDNREFGEVLSPPMAVVLSDFDIVQPDLVFLSKERLALIDEAPPKWRSGSGGRGALPFHPAPGSLQQAASLRTGRRHRVLGARSG